MASAFASTSAGTARDPHIWLVNLFFGIGPAPTGALLEGVAVGLQERGWRVVVLSGAAAYGGAAAPGPTRFSGPVHWLGKWAGSGRGVGGRVLAWFVYWVCLARFVFTNPLPTKVLLMTTPPFLHLLFVVRNWLTWRKAELILWNQDTYPDILAAVGLLAPTSGLFRALRFLQGWGLRRVHKVIVLDQAMETIYRGHEARQIRVIPNWEIALPPGMELPVGDLRRCVEDARKTCRHLVLYTGNYGWGHDLGILFTYLQRRPDQRDFFFLFVGGGEKWNEITALPNQGPSGCVGVFAYVPKHEVAALLRHADIGLVALEKACVGLMSPSKIHGYLACGKPLLYIGPQGSNVAAAIARYDCGWQIDEKDGVALERCLEGISETRVDMTGLSRNAARASSERYTEAVGVRDVCEFISWC